MPRYIIQLTPDPQQFSITLGGLDYLVTLLYKNVNEGGWTIDFSDLSKNPIISGVPLTTGVDILGQYGYLGFSGKLTVESGDALNEAPTFENLGINVFLVWTTT